jgi:hypothetical protein
MNNKSISELKKTADDLFRKAIHAMYPEWLNCPTCGVNMENKRMQVGHCFRRNETATRYDLRAATLQCEVCNYADKDLEPYFVEEYGPEWIDEMTAKRRVDIRRAELVEIIEKLKTKP